MVEYKKPHVLLFCFAGKGHINPFMSLATKLAEHGASITLLFPFKSSLALVSPESFQGLDIRLKSLPIPGDEAEDEGAGRATMLGVRRPPVGGVKAFPNLEVFFTQVLEEMMMDSSRSPLIAVVLDPFMPWSAAPVDKLGIPRYIFNTASTSHLALGLHLNANPQSKSLADLKREADEQGGSIEVPGIPMSSIRWEEIAREHVDDSNQFYLGEKLTRSFLLGSEAILMNTCDALEGDVIAGLQAHYPENKFLSVGPLISPKASTFLPSPKEVICQNWLDDQQPRSVVYVSFGSWAALSKTQVEELALGLEASKKKFLWALPVCSKEKRSEEELLDEVLPAGFRKRVSTWGLILPGWAPQSLILAIGHESIGGFVTHESLLKPKTLKPDPLGNAARTSCWLARLRMACLIATTANSPLTRNPGGFREAYRIC